MIDIDRVLKRARLKPATPYTKAHIDAAEERLAVRIAMRRAGDTAPATTPPSPRVEGPQQRAKRDLPLLCEVILTQPTALDDLANTQPWPGTLVPGPTGARALGALLYLAEREDSSCFWWRYAAGGDDSVSSYCLYLFHRSIGEDDDATWWLNHTEVTPATAVTKEATRKEITTALRILQELREDHHPPLPDRLHTLVTNTPSVIDFTRDDDEVELPLPYASLPKLIEAIAASDTPAHRNPCCDNTSPLPSRDQFQREDDPPPPQHSVTFQNAEVRHVLRECANAVACSGR